MTIETRLIDGESGEVVRPSSTVTMPIYELDKIIRKLDEREGQLRECVELLERGRAAINHVGVVTGADEWTEQCDALLARLKETQ